MNVGDHFTVCTSRGVIIEAVVAFRSLVPEPWHSYKSYNITDLYYIWDVDEGVTWLPGWGEDKKAALLLVRSAT